MAAVETPTTPTGRAELGARLLDDHRPGWATRVDLETLRMANCDRCVLGQVYGEYSAGLAALRETLADGETYLDFSLRHGFYAHMREKEGGGWADDPWGDWHELEAAWRREIDERLGAAA